MVTVSNAVDILHDMATEQRRDRYVSRTRTAAAHCSRKQELFSPSARSCSSSSRYKKLTVGHIIVPLYIYLSVCAVHQWDARDQVADTGYNGKQMGCASAQSFGSFRRQIF